MGGALGWRVMGVSTVAPSASPSPIRLSIRTVTEERAALGSLGCIRLSSRQPELLADRCLGHGWAGAGPADGGHAPRRSCGACPYRRRQHDATRRVDRWRRFGRGCTSTPEGLDDTGRRTMAPIHRDHDRWGPKELRPASVVPGPVGYSPARSHFRTRKRRWPDVTAT